MATQPEKSHSTHTAFTFHCDKEKLKDASTASSTAQGVKPTLLPRTREPMLQTALCASVRQEDGIEVFCFSTVRGKGSA